MNVLHVIDAVSWRYGGTTSAVLSLCDALARVKGVNVEIATTDADGPGRRVAPGEVPACTAKIHMFRRTLGNTWKFSRELLDWLDRNVRKYDLVHVHGVWNFPAAVGGWTARRRGVPYVLSPHGMLSRYSWSRSRLMKRVYWELIERANVRAARLHLTSRGEGAEMDWLRLPPTATVIPLGLGPDAFDTPRDAGWLRGRLDGRDRGRPLILFLSRLHPKKGIVDVLLPAFRAVSRDADLVIAGGEDPSDREYAGHVRRAVAESGKSEHIHLIGPVAPADRWRAFDGADLFVLPSYQENFGLVVTEAMARGCPGVVSEHAHAGDLAAEAGAGVVVPLSPQAFAGAMDDLLADPQRRERMAAAGRAAAGRLRWDRLAVRMVEMYSNCTERRRPLRRP